jgi:hypothetical protein
MAPAIALLALASSGIGIVNWFTYDDRYIIELNPAVHDLHRWWTAFQRSYWPKDWGGDGYRPLTILAFKIESVLGGGIPISFHAANILLYMIVAVLVYFVARRLLPEWAAWVTAALFAVHPVHVEAVAGIVGQSELIVALAVMSALYLYLRDRMHGELQTRTAIGICILYAIGCLAKEHGVVLPALLIAAELTVIDDTTPARGRVLRLRPFYLALTAIALAFVAVRAAVLSDHGIGGFQPFIPFGTLHISAANRALTALGVVPQWIRLFYWPAHLSSEYGPPDIQIAQGVGLWQLPGLLLLVAILAIGLVLRRRKPVISFGIAFVCIVLLPSSNFIIPAGIVLAERTLFLPSVGAMLVFGGMLVAAEEWLRTRRRLTPTIVRTAAALAALVIVTGAIRSAQRTTVWKSNETLFNHAVADAPLSYHAHYMLGSWELGTNRQAAGRTEYRRAMALFPYDPGLAFNLAQEYSNQGLCGAAIPLYRWIWQIDSSFVMGRGQYAWCLLDQGMFAEAKAMAYQSMRNGGSIAQMRRIVFLADSTRTADNKQASSRAELEQAGVAKCKSPCKGRHGSAPEQPVGDPATCCQ